MPNDMKDSTGYKFRGLGELLPNVTFVTTLKCIATMLSRTITTEDSHNVGMARCHVIINLDL